MIISNSRRFVFIHIHKSGGTSVTRALADKLEWNDIILGVTPGGVQMERYFQDAFGLDKHSSAQAVRDVVGPEVWDSYLTFSVVRSPYARLASLYTFVARSIQRQGRLRRHRPFHRSDQPPWNWPGTRAYLSSRSFSEFIRNDWLRKGPGAEPMVKRLSADGEIIVDHCLRTENLAEDFAQIAQRVGLRNLKIGRFNVSRADQKLDALYHSQDDLDYVYERYRADFDAFGYPRIALRDLQAA